MPSRGPRRGGRSDLARQLEAPKSSLLNICSALLSERLLRRNSAGRYHLGIRLAEFAAAHLARPPRLRRVGLIVQNFTNPFFVAEKRAVEEVAQRLEAELHVMDAAQDLRRQLRQLRELLDIGVDVVILDAVNSDGVAEGVAAVRGSGTPLVAVNVGATGADATVTADNTQAGELIARHLGAVLKGSGDIAIVGGTPITGIADRITGFLSALRDYPSIHVVARLDGDNTREVGRDLALRILADHPESMRSSASTIRPRSASSTPSKCGVSPRRWSALTDRRRRSP